MKPSRRGEGVQFSKPEKKERRFPTRIEFSSLLFVHGGKSDERFKKLQEYSRVILMYKGKAIAHAKWEDGDLVISKVFQDERKGLREGQIVVVSEVNKKNESSNEIETYGWQLIRYKDYGTHAAVRKDPYWKEYEGWFVIPESINGEMGLKAFLLDYPELLDSGYYEVLTSQDVDSETLRMASYEDINRYVCGLSENIPPLQPFQPPVSEDMVDMRYQSNFTGKYENYKTRYWPNKWVVYVPRKSET